MDHAIEVSSVYKSFSRDGQQIPVLKGIDYVLPKGCFHAIMGASGSGKTTLSNLIAGLLSPDSGLLRINGTDLTALSDRERTLFRRRHVGIVFQDYNLIPGLSVAENIALPALFDGKTLPDVRIDALLALVNLSHRKDHPAECLSGGEAQRTAIARALSINPDVIIADEPTGNLDSPAGKLFCELLMRMNKEQGISIVLISHDPIVAAYASEIYLMRDGRLVRHFESKHDPAEVSKQYLALSNEVGHD